MRVEMLTVGMFQSNCFIASCESTGEAIIIDAGEEGKRIVETVRAHNLDVKMIFNTHAHIDHVSGLSDVLEEIKVPVLMHKNDLSVYEAVAKQAVMFGLSAPSVPSIDRFVNEGDEISFGSHTGRVVNAPGHSPGGVLLVFDGEDPPIAFVGDVLFQGSIGRTDLPGSNHQHMIDTLSNVIMKLPDDMIAYPGHGPETTIGREKRSNPFLLELR